MTSGERSARSADAYPERMKRDPTADTEQALAKIIGTPLWGSARAADMEMFAFGRKTESTDQLGRRIEQGEFALHVQCPWHLERSGSMIIGSGDLYVPATGDSEDEEFDWEPYRSNRRDVLLERFFAGPATTVEGVEAGTAGMLVISLSGDTRLRLFPNRSSLGDEHWRFFELLSDEPHLVFMSEGVRSGQSEN